MRKSCASTRGGAIIGEDIEIELASEAPALKTSVGAEVFAFLGAAQKNDFQRWLLNCNRINAFYRIAMRCASGAAYLGPNQIFGGQFRCQRQNCYAHEAMAGTIDLSRQSLN